MEKSLVEGIGFVAAACTTFSFIPQIVKIRRQGGRDLSYPMLCFYFLGLMFWLAYGVLTNSPAVMAANTVSGLLVLIAIVLKMIWKPPVEQVMEQTTNKARKVQDYDEAIAELSETR